MSNLDHVCFNCQRSEMEMPCSPGATKGKWYGYVVNVCHCLFTNGNRWQKKCSRLKSKIYAAFFSPFTTVKGTHFLARDIDKFIKVSLPAALLKSGFNILISARIQ